MFVKEKFKEFLGLTRDRSIRSRLWPSATEQLVVNPSLGKPAFLGSSLPRGLGNLLSNFLCLCHPRHGLIRTHKMSAGNRPTDKLLEFLEEPTVRAGNEFMSRHRGKDIRFTRLFKSGDIVLPHPKRTDLQTVGKGIVLCEQINLVGPGHRTLLVYFAARDVDLYKEARRYIRSLVMEPDFQPEGIIVPNSDLQFIRSEKDWLNAPDINEVQMMRFADVGKEL